MTTRHIAKTGRNFPVADPARVRQLERLFRTAPRRRTLSVAKAASRRHGLEPPAFDTELGAQCHVVAMTRMVDALAQLVCDKPRRKRDELVH